MVDSSLELPTDGQVSGSIDKMAELKKFNGRKKRRLNSECIPYDDSADSEEGYEHIESDSIMTAAKIEPSLEVTQDYSHHLNDAPVQLNKRKRTSSRPMNEIPSEREINSSTGTTTSTPETTPDLETSPSLDNTKLKKKVKIGGVIKDEEDDFVPQASDEDDDESELSIPSNEKSTVVFDYSSERVKRLTEVVSIAPDIYSEQEKSLFLQLAMRGFQPLFPKHWKHDFPTLPDSLFAISTGKPQPLIQTSRSSAFYAIKSLINLFSLGGRVRDCSIVQKRPETLIKQAITKYIRWAVFDANLEASQISIPVYAIYTQGKGEPTLDAVRNLNRRLKKLALQHGRKSTSNLTPEEVSKKRAYNLIPLLTGFTICGPIVAILTLDTNQTPEESDNIDSKFISQFDLSERGQDVWNCLAIAITVMHIRRTMLQAVK